MAKRFRPIFFLSLFFFLCSEWKLIGENHGEEDKIGPKTDVGVGLSSVGRHRILFRQPRENSSAEFLVSPDVAPGRTSENGRIWSGRIRKWDTDAVFWEDEGTGRMESAPRNRCVAFIFILPEDPEKADAFYRKILDTAGAVDGAGAADGEGVAAGEEKTGRRAERDEVWLLGGDRIRGMVTTFDHRTVSIRLPAGRTVEIPFLRVRAILLDRPGGEGGMEPSDYYTDAI